MQPVARFGAGTNNKKDKRQEEQPASYQRDLAMPRGIAQAIVYHLHSKMDGLCLGDTGLAGPRSAAGRILAPRDLVTLDFVEDVPVTTVSKFLDDWQREDGRPQETNDAGKKLGISE